MTAGEPQRFVLKLFVSGASELSARAITLARAICEDNLAGRYELTVVDINDDQAAVALHDVLAVPMLLRVWPEPVARFVGDLGHTERVLAMLTHASGPAASVTGPT